MRNPDRRSVPRRVLLLSFVLVFVMTTVAFGVTEAGHVAVMQSDAIVATVERVTYVTGPPDLVRIDLRFENPTPRSVLVVTAQQIVVERGGETLVRSTTPTVTPRPLRVPAWGEARATASLGLERPSNELRSALRTGEATVRGVFGGRIGDVAVDVHLSGARDA